MVNEVYLTMKILAKLKSISLLIENQLPEEYEIISDRRRIL